MKRKWPKIAQDDAKIAQDRAKMAQDGGKMAQDGGKMAQDGAKMAHDGAKMAHDVGKAAQEASRPPPAARPAIRPPDYTPHLSTDANSWSSFAGSNNMWFMIYDV